MKIKVLLQFIFQHKWWISVFIMAFIIRIIIAIPLMHDWDGFVFLDSAKNMLHGITPYQTVQSNNPIIYPDSDRPMTQQWYAYPPVPLIMFTIPYAIIMLSRIHGVILPVLQNISIKFSFIIGDLMCAYLIFKFLEKWNKSMGKRATILILFNPLLIWISSAWGMFDLWIINFLLLFFLSLRSRKILLAGILLALTLQVKLFPAFFLPAIIIYFLQTNPDYKKRLHFLVAFTLTTLIIDVPFFLSSPQGFMNQNLLMQLARPPQGIGIIGIIDYLSYIFGFKEGIFVLVGNLLTILCIVVFNLFSIVYIKGRESRLLTVILLIYTSVLLFNKVVNEQYYVVLVALLILLTHLPKSEQAMFSKKLLVIFEGVATISILAAAVLLGFHFLTFLPNFLTNGFFKASTNYLVFYLSRLIPQLPLYAYPNSLWTYYNAPVTVTYIFLIPLIVLSFYVVTIGFIQAIKMRDDLINYVTNINFKIFPLMSYRYILISSLFLLSILIFSIPFVSYLKASNALKLVELVNSQPAAISKSKLKVGVFYYDWWNNPDHDPTVADDAWSKTNLTPLEGYYTSKNSYFVEHIKEMQNAGIDFAVVSYHLYDRQRFLNFSYYADKLGFSYAPMIESDDALSSQNLRPVDPQGNPNIGYKISAQAQRNMENEIVSSLIDVKDDKYLFRIDNKPVVYIYDGHFYLPSWDIPSKKALAKFIYDKYSQLNINTFQTISKAWGIHVSSMNDILAQYPTDIHAFNNSNKNTYKVSNDDYREAFLSEYNAYWKNIKSYVEHKIGSPIYLITTYQTPLFFGGDSVIQPGDQVKMSAFDDEFYYSLSNTWTYWKNVNTPSTIMRVWEKQESDQASRDHAKGWPVFLTVTPTYKDTSIRGSLGFQIPATINGSNIYKWTWQTAIQNKADYVLIASWNEFFESSAIEPSKQYGSYYLYKTKYYTQIYKQNTLAQAQ